VSFDTYGVSFCGSGRFFCFYEFGLGGFLPMKREEVQKQVETAFNELAKALEEGRSETLIRYLQMFSRFHHYSFGNCILIAIQRPDATHVAGFQRWKELGRHVKQGEKGIAILAPLVYRKKQSRDEESEEGSDEKVAVLRGFKVVHVFDISQTDGEELPQFAAPNGDPGEKLPRLEALIRTQGITLRYELIPGGADGVSQGGEIALRPDLTPAKTFSVLVHELAHELLHKGERKHQVARTVKETEAEAVAFVVSKAVGLNPTTSASDYIQLYSGNKDVLQQSLDYIQRTASFILTALDGSREEKEVAHAV
jgi:antirestriction protein ArdC